MRRDPSDGRHGASVSSRCADCWPKPRDVPAGQAEALIDHSGRSRTHVVAPWGAESDNDELHLHVEECPPSGPFLDVAWQGGLATEIGLCSRRGYEHTPYSLRSITSDVSKGLFGVAQEHLQESILNRLCKSLF